MITVSNIELPQIDPNDPTNGIQVALAVQQWATVITEAVAELQKFIADGQGLTLTTYSASDYIAGTTGIVDRTGATLLFDGDPTGGAGAAGWWQYNGSTWVHL